LSRLIYTLTYKISPDNEPAKSGSKAHDVELCALDDATHDPEPDSDPAERYATAYDIHDMDALGLEPTFRRRFKLLAMIGFSSMVAIAWQNTFATFTFALYNGGTGSYFWTCVFSTITITLVYPSLAELSSSYVPTPCLHMIRLTLVEVPHRWR